VAETGKRLPVRRKRRDKTVGVFNGEQMVFSDHWTLALIFNLRGL
jgi:hypothetical protein